MDRLAAIGGQGSGHFPAKAWICQGLPACDAARDGSALAARNAKFTASFRRKLLLYDHEHLIGSVMRYSKEHKQETHARIVRKASVRLREKGANGIGVADLMKEAGLTHGGFYAHFDSREALVIEAFGYAMDRAMEHWRKQSDQVAPEKQLAQIVETYLSTLHRD